MFKNSQNFTINKKYMKTDEIFTLILGLKGLIHLGKCSPVEIIFGVCKSKKICFHGITFFMIFWGVCSFLVFT